MSIWKVQNNELVPIAGNGGGSSIEIVDNLLDSSVDKALSANQGKILNSKMIKCIDVMLTSEFDINSAYGFLGNDYGVQFPYFIVGHPTNEEAASTAPFGNKEFLMMGFQSTGTSGYQIAWANNEKGFKQRFCTNNTWTLWENGGSAEYNAGTAAPTTLADGELYVQYFE